jgi:predicted MFS family arabinose efflux permease
MHDASRTSFAEINSIGHDLVSSYKIIFGTIAVSIAFVMELTLVPLFLPSIQTEFDLSINALAWFFNAYGIAVAVGVLFGGWFGDNYDIKRVFSLGVLFFALGSALVVTAENYQLIQFARALQGFGGGIFSPLVPILLTRASPARPGRILILWGSISGYAAALAPLLYSSILSGFGWTFAFTMFAVVSICALVVVQFSSIPHEAASKAQGWLDHTRVFRSPQLWLMFGYIFCTYGSISFYLFFVPIRLDDSGLTIMSIGLTLSIMWLTFSIISTLLRNAIDEPHVRGILTIAPVFIAAGFGLAQYSDSLILWALSAILVGVGLACSNAPSTLLVLKFAPKGTSGIAASLDISFARIGGVIAIFGLAQSSFSMAAIGICLLSVAAILFAHQATKNLDQHSELTAVSRR